MRGNRPLALGGVLVSWFWFFVWWAFVWFWGCLCSFPPHHVVFPSPSMMTWALRPHGVRTRGKKLNVEFIAPFHSRVRSPDLHHFVSHLGRI